MEFAVIAPALAVILSQWSMSARRFPVHRTRPVAVGGQWIRDEPLERYQRHRGRGYRSPAIGLDRRNCRRTAPFLHVQRQQLLQPAGQQCDSPIAASTCCPTGNCASSGQAIYLTASRPNSSIILSSIGTTLHVCEIARFQ
jgi:hypothetical protein